MRFAIPTDHDRGLDSPVLKGFSKCKYFLIVDAEDGRVKKIEAMPNKMPPEVDDITGVQAFFLAGRGVEAVLVNDIPEKDRLSLVGNNIRVFLDASGTAADALEEIGAHSDEVGVFFASETGPESGAALASFLRGLKAKSIRANYDPANMVMRGFDPVQGVYDLGDLIVHTHAKDGIGPGPNRGEVPLGEGDVPWPEYLRALKEIGYDRYLTIEREVGEDPAADIVTAANFLREQLANL